MSTPLKRGGYFVIRRLKFDTFYMCIKFDDSSFSRPEISLGPENLKWVT